MPKVEVIAGLRGVRNPLGEAQEAVRLLRAGRRAEALGIINRVAADAEDASRRDVTAAEQPALPLK